MVVALLTLDLIDLAFSYSLVSDLTNVAACKISSSGAHLQAQNKFLGYLLALHNFCHFINAKICTICKFLWNLVKNEDSLNI